MQKNEDLVFINRVITQKPHKAFTRLVDKYQSGIRHFLRRLNAGDYHMVEDLSQETFIIAFEKIHQYKSIGSFNAWLHTIAYRLFIKNQKSGNKIYHPYPQQNTFNNNGLEADVYAEQLMLVKYKTTGCVNIVLCSRHESH